MVRARSLCFLLIGSAFLWAALAVLCPLSRQADLFHHLGSDLFGDFAIPRTCAQEADPYLAHVIDSHDRCYAMIGYLMARVFPEDALTGGLVFTMAGAVLFVLALGALIDAKGRGEWWIIPAAVLSAPFLYSLERANQIWIAASGVLLFLAWHDSESRWRRLMAMLALAFASALKITPGVFSLLLLKERRWRDFLAFSLASVALTAVPFVLWGDVGMVGEWLSRMSEHNRYYRIWKCWGGVRLLWIVERMLMRIGVVMPPLWIFGQLVDSLAGGLALWCFFKTKERRDEAFLLAVLAMILPSVSQTYTLLYVFPAVALLCNVRLSPGEAALWFFLLTPLQPNLMRYSFNPFAVNVAFFSLIAYRCARTLRGPQT